MKSRSKKGPGLPGAPVYVEQRASPQLELLANVDTAPARAAGEILDAVAGGSTAYRMRRAFEFMEIAEELLAKRWPGRLNEPRGAFKLLFATMPVRISEKLYRAHVAEILEHLPDGPIPPRDPCWNALRKLTRAEILGLLVETSLRHPLGHHDVCLYESFFVELFPEQAHHVDSGDVLGETAKGELDRLRAEWLSRESPERGEDIDTARAA